MRVFYPPWKLRTRVLFCLALSWHVPRRARRKGDDDALTTVWFGGFSRHAHKCTKCLLVRSFLSFSLHVRSRSFVMEPSSKRFCFSSPEERQRLVDDAIPKRTADSNSFWKSVFLTYCQSIGKTIDFSTVTAADLAPILESFFVDVRGKNGEPYKGNSLSTTPFPRELRILTAFGSQCSSHIVKVLGKQSTSPPWQQRTLLQY